MDNAPNLESLLRDYINIFRNIQRDQNNTMITYLNSQRDMNSSLSNVIQRYLEIHNNNENTTRLPPRLPSRLPSTLPSTLPYTFRSATPQSFFSPPYRAPVQSPVNSTSYNFSPPSNNTDTFNPTISRPRNSIFTRNRTTSTLSAPRTRTRTRTTTTRTTIPRDIFQNFINNTLNMGNVPQPLNAGDISANITNLLYGDIVETTTQTICPFTQDTLSNNDEISRVNACGHIFTRSNLHRYLTNFDYRCPVCRRDLRREINIENPFNSTTNMIDLSNNTTLIPDINNNTQSRDIINNAVESVTNALMTNISNQISNDPSNNSFIAEYSFLIPNFNNATNTNPITTNTHLSNLYLQNNTGIHSAQQPLPVLPEDSEDEMTDQEDSNDEMPGLEDGGDEMSDTENIILDNPF